MAIKYRCYLIRDEHIAANEIIDCNDDAAAVIAADQILSATTTYTHAVVRDRAHGVVDQQEIIRCVKIADR